MNRIFIIARHTLKETIRDKVVYGILIFGLMFMASTVLLGSLSLGENLKVIRDFGLAGIYIFGFIITIFLGASLMHKEVVDRTIYMVLAKPVSVAEALVGKFLGLFTSMSIATLLMAMLYMVIVFWNGGGIDFLSLEAVLLQVFELAVFIALAIFFSLLYGPLPAVIFNLCLLYIGHSLELLIKYGEASGITAMKWVTIASYYLLPNFEKFNIRDLVIYQESVSYTVVAVAFMYALAYCSLLIWGAVAVLKHKEL